MIPLLQLVAPPPDCYDFSNVKKSGLGTSPDASLMTHRCTSSVPWPWAPSGSLDGLQPDLLLHWAGLQPLPSPSAPWAVLLELLLVKFSQVVEYLSILHVLGIPFFSRVAPHFPYFSFCHQHICRNYSLMFLERLNSIKALPFLT